MSKSLKDILQAIAATVVGFFLLALAMVWVLFLINGGDTPRVGDSLERVLAIAHKRQHEWISVRRIEVVVYKAGDEEKLLTYFRKGKIVLEDDSYNVSVKDTKDPENYGYILHKENGTIERQSVVPIENQIIMFIFPTGMRSWYVIDKNNTVIQELSEG